jgi:uncharacterized protein
MNAEKSTLTWAASVGMIVQSSAGYTGSSGRRRRALKFRPIAVLALCAALLLTACLKLPPATAQSRYGDLNKEFPGHPQAAALALAAEHGDVKEIRRLMKDEGVNPDTVFSKDGMPLVAWPVFTENPAGLKAMLENGADPNARDPKPFAVTKEADGSGGAYYHDNALVWAAKADDPIYLKLLLDHGGNPDTRNSNNETLLLQAKFLGTWENIELLVERGADINAQSQQTAFVDEYAGLGSFVRTLWLLEHGAKPTQYTIDNIFWHPGNPKKPESQRQCQQWLLQHGYKRPPVMSKGNRKLRTAYGFPTDEKDIPLL